MSNSSADSDSDLDGAVQGNQNDSDSSPQTTPASSPKLRPSQLPASGNSHSAIDSVRQVQTATFSSSSSDSDRSDSEKKLEVGRTASTKQKQSNAQPSTGFSAVSGNEQIRVNIPKAGSELEVSSDDSSQAHESKARTQTLCPAQNTQAVQSLSSSSAASDSSDEEHVGRRRKQRALKIPEDIPGELPHTAATASTSGPKTEFGCRDVLLNPTDQVPASAASEVLASVEAISYESSPSMDAKHIPATLAAKTAKLKITSPETSSDSDSMPNVSVNSGMPMGTLQPDTKLRVGTSSDSEDTEGACMASRSREDVPYEGETQTLTTSISGLGSKSARETGHESCSQMESSSSFHPDEELDGLQLDDLQRPKEEVGNCIEYSRTDTMTPAATKSPQPETASTPRGALSCGPRVDHHGNLVHGVSDLPHDLGSPLRSPANMSSNVVKHILPGARVDAFEGNRVVSQAVDPSEPGSPAVERTRLAQNPWLDPSNFKMFATRSLTMPPLASLDISNDHVSQELLDHHIWEICHEHEGFLRVSHEQGALRYVHVEDQLRAWRRKVRQLRRSLPPSLVAASLSSPSLQKVSKQVVHHADQVAERMQLLGMLAEHFEELVSVTAEAQQLASPNKSHQQDYGCGPFHLLEMEKAALENRCALLRARLEYFDHFSSSMPGLALPASSSSAARANKVSVQGDWDQCVPEAEAKFEPGSGSGYLEPHDPHLFQVVSSRSSNVKRLISKGTPDSRSDASPQTSNSPISELLLLRKEVQAIRSRFQQQQHAVQSWNRSERIHEVSAHSRSLQPVAQRLW